MLDMDEEGMEKSADDQYHKLIFAGPRVRMGIHLASKGWSALSCNEQHFAGLRTTELQGARLRPTRIR